jgi:hypothetical protein
MRGALWVRILSWLQSTKKYANNARSGLALGDRNGLRLLSGAVLRRVEWRRWAVPREIDEFVWNGEKLLQRPKNIPEVLHTMGHKNRPTSARVLSVSLHPINGLVLNTKWVSQRSLLTPHSLLFSLSELRYISSLLFLYKTSGYISLSSRVHCWGSPESLRGHRRTGQAPSRRALWTMRLLVLRV